MTTNPSCFKSKTITFCIALFFAFTKIMAEDGNAYHLAGITRISFSTVSMWTGSFNADWNDFRNWSAGEVPTIASDVVIPMTTNQPFITSSQAIANSVTINGGAVLTMQNGYDLTINNGGYFENNNGSLNATASTGAVIFAGSGTIKGTSFVTFNNITINGPLTLSVAPVIDGTFTINSGTVSGNTPGYTGNSTLKYNISGLYTTGVEWYDGGTTTTSPGSGIPQNVTLESGTITVNTGPAYANRSLAGNLVINAGCMLILKAGSNPTLTVTGNWTNNGTFNANGKTVTFNGSTTNTLAGNTTFFNITINKSGGSLTIAAPHTTINHNLTVSAGSMKPAINTLVEFTGIGNLAGVNDKAFYDLQIDNTSEMTITSGGVSITHDFINNGIYTYSGIPRLTTFGGSGITQSMSAAAGSTTIFGNVVVGDNHVFSNPITLNCTNNYTIQGTSLSLSNGSFLNNSNNVVIFSTAATTTISGNAGTANFFNMVINVPLNPGNNVSIVNNTLTINTGGSVITYPPVYNTSASLIYNTSNINFPTGFEWTGNTIVTGVGTPENVTVQNGGSIVLSGSRAIPGTLNLNAGNSLDINGNMLTVNNGFSGTGYLKGSSSSNLISNGSGNMYFDPVANILKTLNITSGAITLGNALNIAAGTYLSPGKLTVDGIFNTGGYLTLKSDALGTAMAGISVGAINGPVTVERYIPSRRAWRFLSVPFISSTQTISQAWQEGKVNPDLNCGNNQYIEPGFGTQLTYNATNGYDPNITTNPSVKVWQNNMWITPSSTTGVNFAGYPAYCLFVRGDRTICLSQGQAAGSNVTTLRPKGVLGETGLAGNAVTKIYTGSSPGDKILVGNPYASAINIGDLVNNRIAGIEQNKFWIWDPAITGGATNNVGGYIAYSNGVLSNTGPNFPDAASALVVASGQAFMLQLSSASISAAMLFLQTDKVENATDVFGLQGTKHTGNSRAIIYTQLLAGAEDNTAMDGVAVCFGKNYSAKIDKSDADKMFNFDENIALLRDGSMLAIEFRPLPVAADTIFYRLFLKQKPYTLRIFAKNFPSYLKNKTWIIDKYLGTQKKINLKDTCLYDFIPNTDTNSYRNRFMLVFRRSKKSSLDIGADYVKSLYALQTDVAVYPNPVIGKSFNLILNNLQKGKYTVNIYAPGGIPVASKIINHNKGKEVYKISLISITAGVYNVQVKSSESDKIIKSIRLLVSR